MSLRWLLLPLLLQVAMTPQASAADVGWIIDQSGMDEVLAADGVSRMFFPKGQSALSWKERYTIQRLGAFATPAQAMDAQEAERRGSCPGFSSRALPGAPDGAATVRMWNCPEDTEGRGTTAFVKTVLANGNAFLATAEKRGAAVPAGKVQPISGEDISRYAAFVMSLAACTELTVPGGASLAAIMGEYGDLPLSDSDRAAIERTTRRGLAIHRQDQLAWHATDYALAQGLLSDNASAGGFFSVAGEGQAGSTYFISTARGKQGVVRIDSDASGQLTGEALEGGLPAVLQPRWNAVQTAKADPRLAVCGERVNTVVLPNDEGDGWLVYVMSATADERRVFLGGHNRVEVDPAGRVIRKVEHSAKSCAAFDAVQLRALKRTEGFFLSHLVSPYPWETDVMQSLTYAVPLTRVATTGIWRIEGNAIRKLATAAP